MTDEQFAKFIEADNPQRLLMLQEDYRNAKCDAQKSFYEGYMIGISIDLDEHPEGFESACMCASCRSYA